MKLLYPLLKVMLYATIVLQVKDSREKKRETPPLDVEKEGQRERIKISLCFTLPPFVLSLSAPFSPQGGISGAGLS